MANTNKKRIIQNTFLIAILACLIFFIWVKKPSTENHASTTLYDKSIGDTVSEIKIQVKGRDEILLKSDKNEWKVVQPIQLKADKEQVQLLFTLLSENAETRYAAAGKDLSKFGLAEELISVSFNQTKFVFGDYNTVSQKRYILKGDTIYLVSETVSGLLQTGIEAFKSKETNTSGNATSSPQ